MLITNSQVMCQTFLFLENYGDTKFDTNWFSHKTPTLNTFIYK